MVMAITLIVAILVTEETLSGAGSREKLNRLALLLNVLNNIKAEEQEDKSTVLPLDLAEIPGEIKEIIQ